MVIERATYFHACHIASSTSVKQHKLRKRIAWLSEKEGKAKEFVSLYIPIEVSLRFLDTNMQTVKGLFLFFLY